MEPEGSGAAYAAVYSIGVISTTGPTGLSHLDEPTESEAEPSLRLTSSCQSSQNPTESHSTSELNTKQADISCSPLTEVSPINQSTNEAKETGKPNSKVAFKEELRRPSLGLRVSPSTFNANFRVHSRHRSIGRAGELALLAQLAQVAPMNQRQAIQLQSTRHLFPGEHGSSVSVTRSQHSSSFSQTNNTENRDASELAIDYEKRASVKPESRGAWPLIKIEKSKNHSENNMSKTIQSIQSLSVQLNRAVSMQSQLDEICHLGPMSAGSSQSSPNAVTTSGSTKLDGDKSKNSSLGSKKLSHIVSKKASRIKELFLQNLGKAEKTHDELFKMYEDNFYKQQTIASKLHKEFKNYVNSLTAVNEVNKNLNNCLQLATGEYQSVRHDLICENLGQLDQLNEDLINKMRNQILVQMQQHLSQFSDLRDKIAKRRRKLIDYDSSKRHYELMLNNINRKRLQQQFQQQHHQNEGPNQSQRLSLRSAFSLGHQPEPDSLQVATNQLVDEARLLKLREQFNYCKVMFDTINGELQEELPLVYEKKMKTLLMGLQNYFALEAQYHLDSSKLFSTASDVIDELPMSICAQHRHDRQNHQSQFHNISHLQRQSAQILNRSSTEDNVIPSDGGHVEYENSKACLASGSSGMGSSREESSLDEEESSSSSEDVVSGKDSPMDEIMVKVEFGQLNINDESDLKESETEGYPGGRSDVVSKEVGSEAAVGEICKNEQSTKTRPEKVDQTIDKSSSERAAEFRSEPTVSISGVSNCVNSIHNDEDSKSSSCNELQVALDIQKPMSEVGKGDFLYKVKTLYKYLAEDVDELCFEADEILQVVEFEQNQEPEEGWLMGMREVNGQRGLFPANFTLRI